MFIFYLKNQLIQMLKIIHTVVEVMKFLQLFLILSKINKR